MPFDPALDWLRDEIVLAGQSVGVRVERADDIFEAGVIIDQIKERISQADVVIAVCTGRNPNVFYELGIAERVHKPILLAEEETDLPFDVRHFRALFYRKGSQHEGRETLRKGIATAIEETIAAREKVAAGADRAPESGQTAPQVLDQSMMQLTVAGLHRKGSLDRIPVDVIALVEEIGSFEDKGRRARKAEVLQGEPMLGRPSHEVEAQAEQLGLMTTDYDLDELDWFLALTEKGGSLLQALEKWRERDFG